MGAILTGISLGQASAQPAPAQAAAKPDDTPSVRVGATIFTDYTYTRSPETTDADGNVIHPSAFNLTRSYINVTGNISHLVAFRVTPDIARETGAGSSLNGSLTFRLKYAFGQFNLDDWVGRGSWARLGIQPTPWVNFEEDVYRYRFQGTVFVEREGFLSSSDAGASAHYALPGDYGDVHIGVFNGENYNKPEVNDQKALQLRGTVRPFARGVAAPLRGLRAHVVYDADHYVKNASRRRTMGSLTFEHRFVNAAVDYLDAADQPSTGVAQTDSRGYSVWATPKSPIGWEGVLRYDHLVSDTAGLPRQTRTRTIAGVAYWFPHQGPVAAALLFDYDGQKFRDAVPAQQRLAVHALINF